MNSAELSKEFMRKARDQGLDVDVLGHGGINSIMAVVGEAPGEVEKKQRMPFVGGSGMLLWKSLRKIGVSRNDVYCTNVVKRQVSLSTKGNARAPVPTAEMQYWRHLLLWELAQLPNLRYIIILGGVALEALTDNTGIMSWRGSVLDVEMGGRTIQCVCCYNPAFVLREPKMEITFRFDIGKVKIVREGNYIKPEIIAHINPTYTQAIEWIDSMRQPDLPISIDIETDGNETTCVGLSNLDNEGMCINFRVYNENCYSLKEEIEIRQQLQTIFSRPDLRFIMQNGVFDHAWMWKKDLLRVHGVWFDTLLAHHTLYSQLPHDLGFLTAQYTFHPYYKDEKDTWKEGGNIDEFWQYNVKDVCITRMIHKKLRQELRTAGLEDFFFNHVMRLQPHLVEMEVAGIRADRELKETVAADLQVEVGNMLIEFEEMCRKLTRDEDYVINPNSWVQLAKLFFHDLKLIGRGTSTNAANRQKMLDHHRTSEGAREMLTLLNRYKTEHKFLTTYAESRLDEDDRFRCEYKQFGTQKAPGRLSSSQTPWGTGMNFQNQPERNKSVFMADEGYEFGYFDLAQAEARVVAWLYKIYTWKEQFEYARLNPGTYDCHRALAADMWDMAYEDTPLTDYNKDGTHSLRYTAKRCRHGLNYRLGPEKLAETTGLSLREAIDAYDRYHRTTPQIKQGWDTTERNVKKNRVLINAYGRRLIILERLTPEALESIIAFYPQSTIGDKVCQVIYQSHDDDNWPDEARIKLNIHDALICHAKPEHLKTCLSIMRKYAEKPILIEGEELIIPADMKRSVADEQGIHRWSNLKEIVL